MSAPLVPAKLSVLDVNRKGSESLLEIVPVAVTSAVRLSPVNLILTVSSFSTEVSPLMTTLTVAVF